MGFGEAIRSGFARYFDFGTRSSRSEFWWWTLFCLVAQVILNIVDVMFFGPSVEGFGDEYASRFDGGILGGIFQLAILVPSLAVGARRLHDTNRSGWWQAGSLLLFIAGAAALYASGVLAIILILGGFAMGIVLIVWWATRGNVGENRFGDDPLGLASEQLGQTFQ